MKKLHYLPASEPKRVHWLNNFTDKLKNVYAAKYGISSADADKYVAYALFYAFLIDYLTELHKFSKTVTDYKNNYGFAALGSLLEAVPVFSMAIPATIPTEAGIFTILAGVIQNIKSNPKYMEADGKDLGIVGDEHSFNPDEYVPTGKGEAMPGYSKISFDKLGVDGMNIYSHPVGSTDPTLWERIATSHHSPYHDIRPLLKAGVPENREYYLRGEMHDVEIGHNSDTIKVTFAG